jgi:hypothetical protein
MIKAIAIEQQVFEELRPVFNYFDRYWMGVVWLIILWSHSMRHYLGTWEFIHHYGHFMVNFFEALIKKS